MTARQHIWLWGLLIALVAATILIATAAWSQTGVEIPLERIHRGDPGDRFLDAEISVTDAQVGQICEATLDRRNNESTHEGTNLLIESGANGAFFFNIESEAFDETTRNFVIDGDISIYTQIGEDGVSSMGFLLEFECNPPPTTTTTQQTTTTSSSTTTTTVVSPPSTLPPATTTTLNPPTTTELPPVNGIDTGGGACADGACDGSLSPLTTWALVGAAWLGISGFAWAAIASLKKEMRGD